MLSAILFATLAAAPAHDSSGIDWVEDDWAAAKKRAAAEKKLIAVDVWATWCHTCLSMKNFVLTEKPLASVAKQHVFLSLDYDKEKNAAFFAKYPINAFPTFLVVDPSSDRIVGRWVGSGTAKEMAGFFASADPKRDDAVTRAQRFNASGAYEKAIVTVEAALRKAKTKEAKTALLAPYVEAMWKHDPKACATKGAEHLGSTTNTAPGIDFVGMVAYCAESLDEAAKKQVLDKVVRRLAQLVQQPPKSLEADDVSGLMSTLVGAYDGLGKKKTADALAKRQMVFLERAAKGKPIAARTTFDYHRVNVYLRFGKHAEALAMLEASEKAMPKDFNHPWRIALVHLDKGDTKAGLAAIERALADGYGARRIRLHNTKIDLLLKAGNVGGAKKQLKVARAEIAKLPPAQVRKGWVAGLDARAEKIAKLKDRG